jgi:hypothetical protein
MPVAVLVFLRIGDQATGPRGGDPAKVGTAVLIRALVVKRRFLLSSHNSASRYLR